jgi:hypothetical protein
MAGTLNGMDEAGLWRRWRGDAGVAGATDAARPDLLLLAAYAEGRLDEAQAAPVERWLYANPGAIEDLRAARQAPTLTAQAAPDAIVARAAELVVAGTDRVVPFRRPAAAPRWRSAIAWGGLAASIAVTSLVGFSLGSDAYSSFSSGASAGGFDLLDPPGGLFTGFTEDQST